MKTKWSAKWIWCAQNEPRDYNQTVLFKKEFDLKKTGAASLRITADSWCRVSVNGTWINDGPARAYPNHWQYDELDISSALKTGKNRIEVIARYFGCGTFHQIPQAGGLWAELHLGKMAIGTDSTWLAAPSNAWQQWVPKISIQMEPVEAYDARLEKILDWQPAIEVKRPGKISARNTGLLTRKPLRFKALRSTTIVKRATPHYCVPVAQLAHPGVVEANGRVSRPVVLSSVLNVRKKQQFDFSSTDWNVAVSGRLLKTGKVTLSPGQYPVLFFCAVFYGHNKESGFPFLHLSGAAWGRWSVSVVKEFLFRDDDMIWFWFEHKEALDMERRWFASHEELAKLGTTAPLDVPEEQIFMKDFAADFFAREPAGKADRLFDGKIVKPSSRGDVELCFDLGGQSCGYFDFSIRADEGVIVDVSAVEYITPDGTIQHTLPYNRNSLRYTTKKGLNRFTSLKRRAGQYWFVTLRNQKTPVEIKAVRLIESTAAVQTVEVFKSSDPAVDRIWKISERTLQLCMEDTFTDCPLYEQTLWIGDARNEALYAFAAYGNYDVSARSLELGAQSLEKFPMVGCQVPSSWDCLLPAWSFLWGMHVWEHYFYSGDKRLLKKLWPDVLKNLAGSEQFMDSNGLFSGTLWNLLEWAPLDHAHATVLHNSMLLVSALKAAENCAEVLKDDEALKKLRVRRGKLIHAINVWWDESKQSYPDALLEDGTPSSKTCQHTSMLAIMCDIASSKVWRPALNNLLNPPKGMTTVGAPFAMQFMYEALEKAGEFDALLNSIRTKFQPMIDAGASTVWEMFAGSDFDTHGFPTRSHCHAWSSSPIYFLNRIVLGIRQTQPGGKAFEISPWLGGLNYARGATVTPKGPVHVGWKIEGKSLQVIITAPKGVNVNFKSNASHKGLSIGYSVIRS